MAVAVQAYQEAREVLERVGVSRLQQLIESKLKFDRYDVVEQLARLQGTLDSWAADQPKSVDHDAPSGPLA
jgi:hypothetical protein